jgi:hypothetical protein
MLRLRRRTISSCVFLVLTAAASAACAGDSFPFGSELMLDAQPMRGSKRVPMIQIEEGGAVSIDLWCVSLRGTATVGDVAFTIVPNLAAGSGNTPQIACDDDRKARDADLLAALTQVTGWRKSGELVDLTGPTPLRFRMMTN